MTTSVMFSRSLLLKHCLSSNSPFSSASRCLVPSRSVFRCFSNAADDTKLEGQSQEPTSTVKVLYDGECNICVHEVSVLKRLARQRPVLFVDISTPDFRADRFEGVTYEMAMKEMHVIAANGKVLVQADAIREMYRACGLGWVAAFTELPVLEKVCNYLYTQFAVYRLRAALDRCESGVSCSIKLKHLKDKLRSPQN
ncbi:uncharacterized protein LOC143284866 [Babylonia areolata]|uniref:uncharacterized protein LOC143284866 n=1 Tax=Babylonia areolata TaxID=304850 RepID=UPI003FD1D0F7